MQKVLEIAGPHAARIGELWWLVLAVCGAVFIAVLATFLYALWRAPRASSTTPPDLSSLMRPERGARMWVAAALAVASVGLLFLIFASVATDRALAGLSAEDPLRIRVTAAQWFWEVRYEDAVPSRMFTTANEIHIPVGRPVSITLQSRDVIHSFWVPSLHGKKDLIPGRSASIDIRADKAGTYRGQCAEFCGHQHAKMAFMVIAHPPQEYEAWAEAQRKPAPPPSGKLEQRGFDVFMNGRCATCHTISGTPAHGRLGPDLTHLAGRLTIAAGTLPNTRGHRAGWIVDPHSIKAGVRMPSNALPPQDLQALLAYLDTLE